MFKRKLLKSLQKWSKTKNHKPLILRGARQVGKTSLVRQLAELEFENIVEVNFDHPAQSDLISLFENHAPQKIIKLLEVFFQTTITPGKTLLFLDEIQSAPKALSQLRYFYEDLPHLHVIAAGSLLDFVLAEHDFSMPVGRIEYLHLSPCSFEEFLQAMSQNQLLDFIQSYTLTEDFPNPLHNQLMEWIRVYFTIGGMPEVIQDYSQNQNLNRCSRIQENILNTYEDDFHKYKVRANQKRIKKVFQKIPHLVGQKVKYVNISREDQSRTIAETIDLLAMARVCSKVYHSSAQKLPLRAGINEKHFKLLFLDVGLLMRSTGLTAMDAESLQDLNLLNQGAITEQFIGQHLLYNRPHYETPQVFYWQREQKNSSAEIDYVISHKQNIIPIEVKSGKTGTLKSLHFFAKTHQSGLAIRFNSNPPSIYSDDFKLVSLPFYLIEQVNRLLEFD